MKKAGIEGGWIFCIHRYRDACFYAEQTERQAKKRRFIKGNDSVDYYNGNAYTYD